MKKQFNYFYKNAREAAEAFAVENNGYLNESAEQDDRGLVSADEGDDVPAGFCWSGTVSAIEVISNATYDTLAYFAYWCVDDESTEEED